MQIFDKCNVHYKLQCIIDRVKGRHEHRIAYQSGL